MTAARKLNLISIEDYLAGELESPTKYEYLGGFVYAMAGARNLHNLIKGTSLLPRSIGCAASAVGPGIRTPRFGFNSQATRDSTIRTTPSCAIPIRRATHSMKGPSLFSRWCPRRPAEPMKAKKGCVSTIPSLQVYALVEQDSAAIAVYRRTADGFIPEVYEGLDAVLPLKEVGIELPLSEIYEGVEFTPEPSDDDQ